MTTDRFPAGRVAGAPAQEQVSALDVPYGSLQTYSL